MLKPESINEYIAGFPPDVRSILRKIRATIRAAAPDAQEKISYGMPAFTSNGSLVYFAAFKKHIGFYPPLRADAKLRQQLSRYANAKGNLRFPLDEPMPYVLIGKIVKTRVRENRAAADARKKKR